MLLSNRHTSPSRGNTSQWYRTHTRASISNNVHTLDRVKKQHQRITAIFIAISMLFAVTIVGLFPDRHSAAATAGSLCQPQKITFGDTASYANNSKDSGIATYVGGDMIIGDPNSYRDENNPTGSYAAEAEGLTLVRGNFWARPLKGFFTMGTVEFGAQYLPENSNATILAIGGNAKTWEYRAGIKQREGSSYGVHIGGDNKDITNPNSNKLRDDYKGNKKSIQQYTQGDLVTQDSELQSTNFTVDKHNYATDNPISQQLGTSLGELKAPGTVEVDAAPVQNDYVRYKYDGSVKATIPLKAGVEKRVTFKGDNTSLFQVFTVKASDLSSDGFSGTDFAFTDIPNQASVLINVTGENDGQADEISYRQGWRFWWNGTEISNGYLIANPDNSFGAQDVANRQYANRKTIRDLYTTAASSIMWNFNAKKVEVFGAKTPAGGVHVDINRSMYHNSGWGNYENGVAYDDPSAALLGSVLVQDGNFTSHVTTNGRVWVGRNYAMYNPASARVTQGENSGSYPEYGSSNTTSIIDMDQERHSLPWTGATSSSCSVVEWKKTDAEGNPRTGSVWEIHATLDDANKAAKYYDNPSEYTGGKPTPIAVINDGGKNDMNPEVGVIRTMNLAPKADYYIIEVAPPSGYVIPQDSSGRPVYHVNTATTGDDFNYVTQKVVPSSTGDVRYVEGTDAGMLSNDSEGAYSIVNNPQGGEINWTKIKEGDSSQTPLAGSEWQISTDASFPNETNKTWKVEDFTKSATKVTLESSTGNWNVIGNLHVNATVEPADASQEVNWSIIKGSEFASVDAQGTVIALQSGPATLQACSATNPGICAEQQLTVASQVAVDSVTISPTVATIKKGSTIDYVAKAFDADGKDVTSQVVFAWSTPSDKIQITQQSDTSHATVRGRDVDSTTITVSVNGKTASSQISVVADITTIYLKKVADWGNDGEIVRVHYGPKGSPDWKNSMPMQTSTCNPEYLVVTINEKFDSAYQFGFQHKTKDSKIFNGWYYNNNATDHNFTFNGSDTYTVESGTSNHNNPPSGCVVNTNTLTIAALNADTSTVRAAVAYVDSTDLRATSGTVRTVADISGGGSSYLPVAGVMADNNPAVGVFQVKNLAAGTYYLHETTAPEGYQLSKVIYKITLGKDGVTWEQSTDDGKTFTKLPAGQAPGIIPDKPTRVTWSKSNEKGELLKGSVWDIYRKNADGTYSSTPLVSEGISDCTSSSGCGNGTYVDQDNDEGVITLKGLVFGTYKVVERTAPAGYWLDCTYDQGGKHCTSNIYEFTLNEKNADVTLNDNKAIVNKLTEVTWQKIDAISQARIGGSEWTLSSPRNEQSWTVRDAVSRGADCQSSETELCDIDPEPGSLKIQGLETGKTYNLKEIKAPDGYISSDQLYVFTVSERASKVTITYPNSVALTDNKILNERQVATVNWKKTDFADGHDLEGAEWKLVQYSETDAKRTTPKVTYTISAAKAEGAEHYTYSCVADDDSNCAFRATDDKGLEAGDPNAGAISFYMTALPWGYYTLTETKAPTGYKKSAREYYFSVTKGEVTWDSSLIDIDAVDEGNNRLNVTNERYITGMPMTGRFLTPRWIVLAGLGICVLAGSSWAIAYFLRRGGRRQHQ